MDQNHYFDETKEFHIRELDISKFEKGKISYGSIELFSDAAHRITNLPIMIARGINDGPTLGLIAVVHGNELNGIMTIHQLFKDLDPMKLTGTIVAIPVVNMHGYLTKQRYFLDSKDLNRVMPGKDHGTPSEIYAYRLMNRIIRHFDYMIDIHTASFGRVNSHYVRADLTNPRVRRMAELQDAEIIVNTKKPSNSFRVSATKAGIPTITVELGNPQLFQRTMVNSGIEGIENIMIDLAMVDGEIIRHNDTIICSHSYWIRVDQGGVLYVYVNLLDKIEKNDLIGKLTDIFGKDIKDFKSPETGIVVGKSTNPVAYTGGRILHIGIIGDIDSEDASKEDESEDADEDY